MNGSTEIVPIPKLYLGTMTFGWSQASSKVNATIALEMMKRFIQFQNDTLHVSKHYIDTARIYAGGKTEYILGSNLPAIQTETKDNDTMTTICIGTKAHPSQSMGLSREGIQEQFQASLASMKVDSVEEFYLHQPDTENSLLDSLKIAHEFVVEGKVKIIGMSNYHVSEVKRAFELCEEYKLTKPKVYQGLYNPLNRLVEEELIPLLKQNECAFVAYNPLAAGFLTGKHKRSDMEDGNKGVQKGRFKNNPNYLPRFFTHDNFDALDIIESACEKEGIPLVEATFRWLLRHSALYENDGIVLGFSSMIHLEENLKACHVAATSGPLSSSLLQAFDDAWAITKKGKAFPYWRSFSSDMPDRENLDHGASYSANKAK